MVHNQTCKRSIDSYFTFPKAKNISAPLPYILSVDDDPQVLRAISRDLRAHFRGRYRILSANSGQDAFDSLMELSASNEPVALVLSDQRMPDMTGVDLLEKSRKIFPDTKRVLLTAYSDTDAAIKAINEVQLDFYLLKPWDPPEEKLFPVLDDLLEEWEAQYVPAWRGLNLIGLSFSPDSHRLKDFLSGNLFPYRWLDYQQSTDAADWLERLQLEAGQLPVLVFEDGSHMVRPSLPDVAVKLGLQPEPHHEVYDVAIIGAGPSGLAAAVYGASEGLRTVVLEKRAPGGQAGSSSRIENYLGFPAGLSGADLTRRAVSQATRFGAELLAPVEVQSIRLQDNYRIVELSNGKEIRAISVVLAMGVDYRKLEVLGAEQHAGAGVYYGAAGTEAIACQGNSVYVVGGGNSAGQAAMYLSRFASEVHILIRSNNLHETMSHYLIEQLKNTPNISIHPFIEVAEVLGTDRMEGVVLKDNQTGESKEMPSAALFIFIGTRPMTQWLPNTILRDSKGFVLTGSNLQQITGFEGFWKLKRQPMILETSLPGVFAAGDIRSGAMNRVASAVGEGSMSIKMVHEYIAIGH